MRVERLQREFPDDVDWAPYELHPETPPEGATIGKPTDSRRAAIAEQLQRAAAAEGLPLRRSSRLSQSRLSLEAGEFARDAGGEHFSRYHAALFRAYFVDERDVGDRAEILRLGDEAGLDAARLDEALTSRAYAPRVDAWTRWAHGRGIYSTPTIIFDDRFALVGAQEYTVFADVTRRLLARKAAESGG